MRQTSNVVGADRSRDQNAMLQGSHRSSVIGNEKGAMFVIPADDGADLSKKAVPKRLQREVPKKLTAEEIKEKQRLAEERKRRHDENKARQARKVSEEAVRFDRKVKARLGNNDGLAEPEKGKRWFQKALDKCTVHEEFQ